MRKSKAKPIRIAVVGIDGSGKSTVIKHIKEMFADHKVDVITSLPRERSVYKLKPTASVLQRLSMKGDERKSKAEILVSQFFYTLIYPFIRIAKEKKSDIIIYERYPPIDFRVYREVYKTPKLSSDISTLLAAAPKVDLLIHLKTDPNVAYKRILSDVKTKKRKKAKHFHEGKAELEALSKKFNDMVRRFKSENPDTIVIELDTSRDDMFGHKLKQELHKALSQKGFISK